MTYKSYMRWLSQYLQSNKDYPRSIMIEVIPHCNLRCVMCPCYIKGEEVTKDRLTDYMTLESFKKIIDLIVGKFNFQVCFTYSGEPLLNKDLRAILMYLRHRGIPSVVHTNGMLLDREVNMFPDRFIISLDGATKETYEEVRKGGDFDKVVKNIRKLTKVEDKWGRSFVELQFIVTSKNRHEIPLFRKLCKELGVDNGYTKSLLVYQGTDNKEYVDTVKGYFTEDTARYDKVDGELVLKNTDGGCPEIQNAVITVDGDVVMCCFDVHGEYTFGNCIRRGLDEIWDDEAYRYFRREVMEKRFLGTCKFCNTSTHITEKT